MAVDNKDQGFPGRQCSEVARDAGRPTAVESRPSAGFGIGRIARFLSTENADS